MAVLKIILLPISLIYGFVVGIRNFFFNTGILKSKSFGIPTLIVGIPKLLDFNIPVLKKKFRIPTTKP